MSSLGLVKPVEYDLNRMTDRVLDARTDHIYFDMTRVLGPQYAKMVEKLSTLEGNKIEAHNNKTLFLEAIDLWGRYRLGAGQPGLNRMGDKAGRRVTDPREAIVWTMEPWYESLELADPREYKLKRREPAPVYVGDEADAVSAILGCAACLDITPMRFVFGGHKENGKEIYDRVWAKVRADGNWYDSDIMTPGSLGDRPSFPLYKEVEVPL